MALGQSALTELLDALRSGRPRPHARGDAARARCSSCCRPSSTWRRPRGSAPPATSATTTAPPHRNGSRLLSTKAGDVELAIPKLRHGSFSPPCSSPVAAIDRALWPVIMEALVQGVSTRKVADLVAALGIDAGVSKSQVSRICAKLDAVALTLNTRPRKTLGWKTPAKTPDKLLRCA